MKASQVVVMISLSAGILWAAGWKADNLNKRIDELSRRLDTPQTSPAWPLNESGLGKQELNSLQSDIDYLAAELSSLRNAIDGLAERSPESDTRQAGIAPAATNRSTEPPEIFHDLRERAFLYDYDWDGINEELVSMSQAENKAFWAEFNDALANGDIQLLGAEPE